MSRTGTVCAALFAIAAASSGCAPAASSGTEAPVPARSNRVLRAEDLQDPSVKDGTLMEAIQRLRPNFLILRTSVDRQGKEPVIEVSINNGTLGPLSTISDIRANTVQSVTLFTAAETGQRFGIRERAGPVLLVMLK